MTDENRPSTDPYKGVRDFYPEDMAIQRYLFDTWAVTAESFGFERYDASVLEPAELYRSKAAENEEIVNEQTYTFIDKGDREVTLRPEMTPTVARMVAGRRRELPLPLRWYSIPNLFRYERAQRGRLREHWQLNADIFGTTDQNADVEIIHLAASIFTAFGATAADFEIKINNRAALTRSIEPLLRPGARLNDMLKLLDMKPKMELERYREEEMKLLTEPFETHSEVPSEVASVLAALAALGVHNAVYEPTIVRGFNYYTGTIFEIFDTNPENRRSLLGGGRYDNLTALFGGEPVPAVGFGMGDVTMRDFLETHDLLKSIPEKLKPGPRVTVVNDGAATVEDAARVAALVRDRGVNVSSNLSDKKLGDQLKLAERSGATFALIIAGDTKMELKRLSDRSITRGELAELIPHMQ